MSSSSATLLCAVDPFVDHVFLALTIVAGISPLLPFLQSLASHGKTRRSWNDGRIQSFRDKFLYGECFTTPKRWFGHFYVVGILSMGFVWWNVVDLKHHQSQDDSSSGLAHRGTQVLLVLHLLRRIYECQYVHIWRSNSRMHLAGYGVGMVHYALLPFVVFDVENLTCGANNGAKRPFFRIATSSASTIAESLAIVMCLYFQFQQYRHHCILAAHRKRGRNSSCTNRNDALPVDGWFRSVCCPHYTAEISLYASLACLNHLVRRWLILLLWVAVNLTVSARSNLAWYEVNSRDDTGKVDHKCARRAILPGLY